MMPVCPHGHSMGIICGICLKKRKKRKKLEDSKENCPHCGVDLQGNPIPKKDQHLFGATHFSRKIGVYDRDKDRTVEYQCPDCGKRWKR